MSFCSVAARDPLVSQRAARSYWASGFCREALGSPSSRNAYFVCVRIILLHLPPCLLCRGWGAARLPLPDSAHGPRGRGHTTQRLARGPLEGRPPPPLRRGFHRAYLSSGREGPVSRGLLRHLQGQFLNRGRVLTSSQRVLPEKPAEGLGLPAPEGPSFCQLCFTPACDLPGASRTAAEVGALCSCTAPWGTLHSVRGLWAPPPAQASRPLGARAPQNKASGGLRKSRLSG